ncbi:MAG: type IX secretion system membrane protein PorP/SprF, partial [Bacteroidota bacterium]
LDMVSYSDFNLGVVWRSEFDFRLGQNVYKNSRSSIGINLSHAPYIFNLQNGNESLQNLSTKTAPRLTLHGGLILPAKIFSGKGRNMQISPNIKFDLQGDQLSNIKENLKVITYGFYVLYQGMYIGAFYQNKHPGIDIQNTNALIITVGAYIKSGRRRDQKKMFVGFSFDANTTGLGTRAGSVYEFAFRYTFENAPALFKSSGGRGKKVLSCPSFY